MWYFSMIVLFFCQSFLLCSFISEINPAWSWHKIFKVMLKFGYLVFFFLKNSGIYIHQDIGSVAFYLLLDTAMSLRKEIWKCCLLQFLEFKDWYIYFTWIFGRNLSGKLSGPGFFLLKILYTACVSLWLLVCQIFCFFMLIQTL